MDNLMDKNKFQRASIRQELAEMWGRLDEKPSQRPSASATLDALSTAIQALDAVDRVERLAESLEKAEAGAIGAAIATEIRNALRRLF